MHSRHSLSEAIRQLKNINTAPRPPASPPSNSKFQNTTIIQFKPERSINKCSNNTESTLSSSNFSKSARYMKPELILDQCQIHQGKSAINSIYSSSTYNPKVVKPLSLSSKDNSSPRSSPSHIRPPESPTEEKGEASPRFSVSLQSSPSISLTNNSKKPIYPPTPPSETFKRSPHHPTPPPTTTVLWNPTNGNHVHFTALALHYTDSQKYYRFGLRLLKQTSDEKRAAFYLKKSADEGHVQAMTLYGKLLYDGYKTGIRRIGKTRFRPIIKKNRKEAARYFKMAADHGDLQSMRKLRAMLYEGDGVEKDTETAILYYKADADKGDINSIIEYGKLLCSENGVGTNPKEGARYLKMAVDKGNPIGMRNYASLFQTGSGVEYSLKEAVKYYKMAADLGDEASAKQIVKILDSGCSFLMGKRESAKYYKVLADKGDSSALKKYKSIISEKK